MVGTAGGLANGCAHEGQAISARAAALVDLTSVTGVAAAVSVGLGTILLLVGAGWLRAGRGAHADFAQATLAVAPARAMRVERARRASTPSAVGVGFGPVDLL